ncbi:MAG: FtsX-like permease family protein [Candidatus Ranarchaeia archaeon]
MKIAIRSRKRFTAFTVIYAILMMWIGITLRSGGIEASLDGWFAIIAGVIVAMLYAFLLSHFRRDDIATLKCIGWSNNDIRLLVMGEIIAVMFTAFFGILELSWHIFGIAFWLNIGGSATPFVIPYNQYLAFWAFPWPIMGLTLGVLLAAQIPGLIITTWRVLSISPMRALRIVE